MTRTWPVAGLIFGVLWVFVRGPALAPDTLAGELLFGLAVGFPVAYVFRRLYSEGINVRRSLRGLPYAVLYVATFVWEAVVSSVDVTYRVLAPSQPIEPEVILIPLRVRTDVGVTTIANSITMTPGSLTLDYDAEENAVYIHVIDGSDPETILRPIRRWENYALIIFDEELSPSDPAPDFAVYPPDQTHPVLEHAMPDSEETVETGEGETSDEQEASDGTETSDEPEASDGTETTGKSDVTDEPEATDGTGDRRSGGDDDGR